MISIHTFIISWKGQHANAAKIAESVKHYSDNTSIIYSDPDPEFSFDPSFNTLQRPNNLMFGDKFHACLGNCKSEILLLIHSDCNCDSWQDVIKKCREAFDKFPEINVWAPSIEFTYYDVKFTEISRIPNSKLSIVAGTDAIVVAFRRGLIDRFAQCDLEKNLHGWGVDWILVCHTYANNMIAVLDRSIHVYHDKSHGYSYSSAREEMIEFLEGLTKSEKTLYKVLRDYIKARKERSREEKRKNKRRFRFW